jgi:hypothetical protein
LKNLKGWQVLQMAQTLWLVQLWLVHLSLVQQLLALDQHRKDYTLAWLKPAREQLKWEIDGET